MNANRHNSKSLLAVITDFVWLFFPRYCLGCADSLVKGEEILCTKCILDLPKTNYHLSKTNPIKERLLGRIPVNEAWAFLKFRKRGSVQHLLHQLKYNNHPEIGVVLGKIYGKELMQSTVKTNYDLIIPVPLHSARKERRGYNQSTKFAEGLSLSMRIPFNEEVCVRTTKTSTQTKKSRVERWENVKDVFEIKDPSLVKGKDIILVDDVITTGATIEALAQHLIEEDANSLTVICLAEAQ